MALNLIPNNPEALIVGLPNQTWFTLLNETRIGPILNEPPRTNDPQVFTAEQAVQCAAVLRDWTPPDDWFRILYKDGEKPGKPIMVEFFETCGGFRTT